MGPFGVTFSAGLSGQIMYVVVVAGASLATIDTPLVDLAGATKTSMAGGLGASAQLLYVTTDAKWHAIASNGFVFAP